MLPITIVLVAVVGFYLIQVQYMAKLFRVPTSANEPAMEVNSIHFGSSLFKPKKNDFVVFKEYDSIFLKEEVNYVFRLIAEAGDTLLIDKGITYVNGINVDSDLILKRAYFLSIDSYNLLPETANHNCYQISREQFLCHLEDEIASQIKGKRRMEEPGSHDKEIFSTYKTSWTLNHFGPLIVEKDHVFVMGDNRDNAYDSRFIGTIPVSSIVAVIKNK